jgi:hypothetical protein
MEWHCTPFHVHCKAQSAGSCEPADVFFPKQQTDTRCHRFPGRPLGGTCFQKP